MKLLFAALVIASMSQANVLGLVYAKGCSSFSKRQAVKVAVQKNPEINEWRALCAKRSFDIHLIKDKPHCQKKKKTNSKFCCGFYVEGMCKPLDNPDPKPLVHCRHGFSAGGGSTYWEFSLTKLKESNQYRIQHALRRKAKKGQAHWRVATGIVALDNFTQNPLEFTGEMINGDLPGKLIGGIEYPKGWFYITENGKEFEDYYAKFPPEKCTITRD